MPINEIGNLINAIINKNNSNPIFIDKELLDKIFIIDNDEQYSLNLYLKKELISILDEILKEENHE